MGQQELDALMAQLFGALREVGIPLSSHISPKVKVNNRAKRRLGCCFFREGGMEIEVSAFILQDRELLRLTLAHELLHTCPGCRNHGPRWKAYAQTASQALGMDIQRTVPCQGPAGPLRHEEVKYVLQCQDCGAVIERMRLSKAVKCPWRYRCRCGGRLKRIH